MDFAMLVIAVKVLQQHLDKNEVSNDQKCPYGFTWDKEKQACVKGRIGF
jgi:hypothetical protein